MKSRLIWGFILPLFLMVSCEKAQETAEEKSESLPLQPLPLDDLSGFQPVADNWKIAGRAWVDRQEERSLSFSEGEGILVCQPTDEHKDNIFTAFEHGDIEIEMDVMVPKNSNSGIYFQGRYEVQVRDSWGKEEVKHGDMGGIYQRWDESRPEGERGFEGIPPKVNASRAPGLWQHLHIVFHAPRFDDSGKKIANAYFEKVVLNGVTVHENVEVTGPTRSAAFEEDEKPMAPMMLQGDHGPVAYKNIRYKLYGEQQVEIRDVMLKEFKSEEDSVVDYSQQPVVQETAVDTFSYHHASDREQYALVYQGKMVLPETGDYMFKTQFGNATGLLVIQNDTLFYSAERKGFSEPIMTSRAFDAGTYDFTFVYNKRTRWWSKGLALYVEGPGIQRHPLHGKGSEDTGSNPEPIFIQASNSPILQRSFIQHGDEKRTHCISVATSKNYHYAYDLAAGSLLKLWSGDFLDATDMWHSRGVAQLGVPLGPVINLHGDPSLLTLEKESQVWPDTLTENIALRPLGYELGEGGLPIFLYQMGNLKLNDQLFPADEERMFHRKLTFQGLAGENTFYKLAEGTDIYPMEDGSFAVNDFSYYLIPRAQTKAKLVQRSSNGRQELLLDLSATNNTAFEYSIVW